MAQVGYKLIDADGAVLAQWGGTWGQCPPLPNVINLPNGDQVYCPELGVAYDGCTLVEWDMDKPVKTTVDGLTFLNRFTDEEYGNILKAAQTDVQIARWLDMFRLSREIDVAGQTAQEAKAAFVEKGLLSAERADVIFAPE
jgi:hypothetical protein